MYSRRAPRTAALSLGYARSIPRALNRWPAPAGRHSFLAARWPLDRIQRAENPRGDCEIYHYNTDGTLDWGYFQINTVHLKRPEVNLRAMQTWRANIDFAYQLYTERASNLGPHTGTVCTGNF